MSGENPGNKWNENYINSCKKSVFSGGGIIAADCLRNIGKKKKAGRGSPRPEQPLGRGSALPRLGAELELRRSGSSGVLGTGLPGLGTEHLPGALCSGTGSPALGLCSP